MWIANKSQMRHNGNPIRFWYTFNQYDKYITRAFVYRSAVRLLCKHVRLKVINRIDVTRKFTSGVRFRVSRSLIGVITRYEFSRRTNRSEYVRVGFADGAVRRFHIREHTYGTKTHTNAKCVWNLLRASSRWRTVQGKKTYSFDVCTESFARITNTSKTGRVRGQIQCYTVTAFLFASFF